ncbi:class I SAM-dependent methyltransferase [Kribbella qitaiheensis]|uniref:class I SAM-dependent methyltransferase n=1 Tax=Kribbella qitaiheensis TaxID=1544730 RepID=UPI00360B2D6F
MTTSPGELRSSWEQQQSVHAPDRELRFALMLDYIERLSDSSSGASGLRVLDLACGPGSITRRVLDRFPFAEVVALDIDPLLLELARNAFAGDARVEVVTRQLAEADWWKDLGGEFDAVLTATAMHWLPPCALSGVYAGVARLLRPGGLFANADHLPLADPVLRDAADGLHAEYLRKTFATGVESCDEWYERAYADPRYEGWWDVRREVFAHWSGDLLEPEEWHLALLRRCGFERAGVVWRRGNDALLIALRGRSAQAMVDDLLDETPRPEVSP